MAGAREADGDGVKLRHNLHHPINTKFPTNWDLQGKREVKSHTYFGSLKWFQHDYYLKRLDQLLLSDPL